MIHNDNIIFFVFNLLANCNKYFYANFLKDKACITLLANCNKYFYANFLKDKACITDFKWINCMLVAVILVFDIEISTSYY